MPQSHPSQDPSTPASPSLRINRVGARAVLRSGAMQPASDIPVTIRGFRPADSRACQTLYLAGLIGDGKIADNDTGFDIDDIESAYMKKAGNTFLVAENQAGELVGMIGVHHHEAGTGEIRRLRVRQDSQRRGIGSKLVEAAVKFCHDNNDLKVTFDTTMDRALATRLFAKFHFRHSMSKNMHGKDLHYFYLDLYSGDAPRRQR
jgi:GNAT superfamily N-acetyltransferase